jgi:anti-sigma factor RsiW
MTSCEHLRPLWNEFAGGELPAADSDALRSHLAECDRCAEAFRLHTEMIARVGRSLEPLKNVRRPTRAASRPWLLNAAVAAALVMAVFGAVLFRPETRTIETDRELSFEVGSRVQARLQPMSRLVVEGDDSVRLDRGEAWFKVVPGAQLRVRTPFGVAEARGAEFIVSLKEDEMQSRAASGAGLVVAVASGIVLFQNLGAKEEIATGQALHVDRWGSAERVSVAQQVRSLEAEVAERERRLEGLRRQTSPPPTATDEAARRRQVEELTQGLSSHDKQEVFSYFLDRKETNEFRERDLTERIKRSLKGLAEELKISPRVADEIVATISKGASRIVALQADWLTPEKVRELASLSSEEIVFALRDRDRAQVAKVGAAMMAEVESTYGAEARRQVERRLGADDSALRSRYVTVLGWLTSKENAPAAVKALDDAFPPGRYPLFDQWKDLILSASEREAIGIRLRALEPLVLPDKRGAYLRYIEADFSKEQTYVEAATAKSYSWIGGLIKVVDVARKLK